MTTNETTVPEQSVVATGDAAPPHVYEVSRPTMWRKVVGVGVGLALLIGVLVTAFAWPAARSAPRDIPVAVVGPADATAQLEAQLESILPGGFDVIAAPDADVASLMILDRDVYGAFLLDADGAPEVLTASGASPPVAQILQSIAGGLTGSDADAAVADDLAPLPADDPRGTAFTAAALPMVIGGMVVGIAMSFVVVGVWRRVVGAVFAAAAAGVVMAAVTQGWLGALGGAYWANAGTIGLTIMAIAMTLIGLVALIGPAGIAVGAVIMFLIGNSISGVGSAPEMLPSGWGALGQVLPPGAGGSMLRSTSFFDGAAAGSPALVLLSWLTVGVLLAAVAHRFRPASHAPIAR